MSKADEDVRAYIMGIIQQSAADKSTKGGTTLASVSS